MKNKNTPHDSAHLHVSGAAEYVDDRPMAKDEVHVDVFFSSVAKAKIKSIDLSQALKVPGVIDIYTSKDLHHNLWGSILQDQPFIASDRVNFVGEPICIIAAENKSVFHEAKRKIKVEFAVEKPVFQIEEAIEKKDFIGLKRQIESGNVEKALKSSPFVIKNQIYMAGQDHFYLESQASIAYPREDEQIEIHSSSQHPTEVQHLVAEALGLKYHQVVCVVKRMGGAFGGKESQAAPFAVFAALVAQKLKRPARLILSKDDDMIMTGKRNPFLNFYEVGFDKTGKILALKAQLFSDGGAYADLSTAIMERAMLHLDNAYYIPNFRVVGQVCRTNTPPNTAFRGFGGPKGVATIEGIIENIALHLKKDSYEIRQKNVYQKKQKTPYGQSIEDSVLPELFSKMAKNSDLAKRRREIAIHNSQKNSDWRGLSATAVKFGISFTTRFLNQANALVNVHLDGTIQVSTGATEMGQGVNTKIAQVVAESFGIDLSDVRVMTTSTEKTPNTSATAASSGSDLNGRAALDACEQIKSRLNRVAQVVLSRAQSLRGRAVAGAGTQKEIDIAKVKHNPSIVFQGGKVFQKKTPKKFILFRDLLQEAYLNRIPVTAQGHYTYPGIFFDKEKGQG